MNHRYDDAHPGEHPPAYDDGYGMYPQSPSAHWEKEPPEGGWHDDPYAQPGPGSHPGNGAPMHQQPGQLQRQNIRPNGWPRRNRRGGRRHRRPPTHPYAGYANANQLAFICNSTLSNTAFVVLCRCCFQSKHHASLRLHMIDLESPVCLA